MDTGTAKKIRSKQDGLHRVTVTPPSTSSRPYPEPRARHPFYNLKAKPVYTTTCARSPCAPTTTPAVESLRCDLYWKLRSTLEALCVEESPQNKPPVLLAFERWQFRCKMLQEAEHVQRPDSGAGAEASGGVLDPLFPTLPGAEAGLVADLERSGLSSTAATRVARALAAESASASEAVLSQRELGRGSAGVRRHRHTLDVFNINKPKKILKITAAHFTKLQQLWRLARSQQGGEGLPEEEAEQAFYDDVLCLLLRYNALSGHGFQAAAGEHVFEILQQLCDAHLECFASPLNCHFPQFCSAFPDTDACFGSLGSFFHFNPTQGSFQANPPFVPEMMQAMVQHMEHLLTRPEAGPLSFCVVVPGWTEVPSWDLLMKSKFKTNIIMIAKEDHGYCDGAQHQRQDRFRDSPYDTAIFFLQNAQGAKSWPLPSTAEADLKAAFAKSIPSEGARARIVGKKTRWGAHEGGGASNETERALGSQETHFKEAF
mmetsp:Transcript_28/g.55  ORF Transcript_28/g.55 Transcript_28/m.55 type:complete len:487 (-) Transcript_28:1071-2531(-)